MKWAQGTRGVTTFEFFIHVVSWAVYAAILSIICSFKLRLNSNLGSTLLGPKCITVSSCVAHLILLDEVTFDSDIDPIHRWITDRIVIHIWFENLITNLYPLEPRQNTSIIFGTQMPVHIWINCRSSLFIIHIVSLIFRKQICR